VPELREAIAKPLPYTARAPGAAVLPLLAVSYYFIGLMGRFCLRTNRPAFKIYKSSEALNGGRPRCSPERSPERNVRQSRSIEAPPNRCFQKGKTSRL
jgi:hypothetical protein